MCLEVRRHRTLKMDFLPLKHFSWQLMLAIGQVIGAAVGLGTHTLNSTA